MDKFNKDIAAKAILKKCKKAKDVRLARALSSKKYYKCVADKMRITALVGTNGKTTGSYMLRHILQVATNKPVGLIGTTGIFGAGQTWDGIVTLTTPDPTDLHNIFYCMYKNGIRDIVMEVSAHAIYYKKVAGIKFASAIYTNITQDHLDFFCDFESYKDTKISFFNDKNIKFAVVNADDEYAAEIKHSRILNYGYDENIAKIIPIKGRFNVYNASGAATVAAQYGIAREKIYEALKTLPQVPGRFNTYDVNGITVVIDYAHTPDGLSKILQNARELSDGKLICVFGCGGGRDAAKRPIMGEIAAANANITVITSDNPRTENPDAIIVQIESGIQRNNINSVLNDYVKIADRKSAIYYALDIASKGDIVIIAGKGHENYMDINGIKIPYNDAAVVKQYMADTEGQ
jgi:UDP-N-acetylmuramoyl-L-alanyl-D-glutamate--2,6-diaminopimelate ligase